MTGSPQQADPRIILFTSYTCSGTAWLWNCFIELGIRCDSHPPVLFDYKGRPSPGMLEYGLLPTADASKPGIPSLTLQTRFLFHDDIFCWFLDHGIPLLKELVTQELMIVLVRDPRDTMWSMYNIIRAHEKGLDFSSYVQGKLPDWIRLYETCLQLPRAKIFRFEDYKRDAEAHLRHILNFSEIVCPDKDIQRVVAASTVEKAREGEQRYFAATPEGKRQYKTTINRSGKPEQWRTLPEHADTLRYIESKAGALMRRFGYPIE